LSKEEVEKMRAEAKANEATDKAEREKVDKLNAADSLVFQTEKQLKEYGEKIPAEKKTAIETAAAKLKEAHKVQDIAAIDTSMAELNAAWTAASQDMYNATQQEGAAQPGAGQQAHTEGAGAKTGEDNVTDVPYEEVK
jgi:molecular chaperone DnaK